MRLKVERVRVKTRGELSPRLRAPRFLPLEIPREIALRVRRSLISFERFAASSVEREPPT